jgi:hypothetical protein
MSEQQADGRWFTLGVLLGGFAGLALARSHLRRSGSLPSGGPGHPAGPAQRAGDAGAAGGAGPRGALEGPGRAG